MNSTVNHQLDQLYRQHYGNAYTSIIRCGIVDEGVYVRTRPKIVFVLKEANDPAPDGGGWSIPDELKRIVFDYMNRNTPLDPAYMHTWRQAGVWVHTIIHGSGAYSRLRDDRFVAIGLQAIGMTNLKKTGGHSVAKATQISRIAAQDRALWQKEIDLMCPDLIICGGTYWDVQKNLALDPQELVTVNGQPYYYSIYGAPHGKCIVLDFWHPAVSRSRAMKSRDDVLRHLDSLISALKAKQLL